MNKLLTSSEKSYILQRKDTVFLGEYTIKSFGKVTVTRSNVQKKDLTGKKRKIEEADTFLIAWDKETFPNTRYGEVKWKLKTRQQDK